MEPLIGALSRARARGGLYFGETTALLLEYAQRHNGVVHGIDTVIKPRSTTSPSVTVTGSCSTGASASRSFRGWAPRTSRSSTATTTSTRTPGAAAAGRGRRDAGHDFPLTFLHDIGWPFGRRDQYHDPDSIPQEHRHPHRLAGIVPGQAELTDEPGLRLMVNAEAEGTPRNGVLTGIEDFMSESALQLTVKTSPASSARGY